ncbi:hypothetical protein KQJ29_33190, partial [Enterococcus sp. S181_ASV_20]|nr:hypothetical protein [Enterococcus sp. S181_ASV_20]
RDLHSQLRRQRQMCIRDRMDGVYVNNLAMAPYVLEPIIQTGKFTTDIHLACVTPEKYIEMFAPLKPDFLTFHIETTEEPEILIQRIHAVSYT